MFNRFSTLSLALLLPLALAACGKQSFDVKRFKSEQGAPGSFLIKPKVDLLFVHDDTGSVNEILAQIQAQTAGFLGQLDAQQIDYHFAVMPLTSDRALTQVAASREDSNWQPFGLWTPPYPGAFPGAPGTVNASVFRRGVSYGGIPADFGAWVANGSSGMSGVEPGLQNIKFFLQNRLGTTSFLRDDALLVIFVVGNGQDTSGVNLCTPPGSGGAQFCNDGSDGASFNAYLNFFRAYKPGGAQQIRMYSAVSESQTSSCLGNPAQNGYRYWQMAQNLGGQNFNLCGQSLASFLSPLSASLTAIRLNFRTRFLILDDEPNPSTLRVTKYVNGTSPVALPQSASNGWTYAGHVTNVHTIDYPVPMNLASGYAIELHGSAKLDGNDTASVDFAPAGAGN